VQCRREHARNSRQRRLGREVKRLKAMEDTEMGTPVASYARRHATVVRNWRAQSAIDQQPGIGDMPDLPGYARGLAGREGWPYRFPPATRRRQCPPRPHGRATLLGVCEAVADRLEVKPGFTLGEFELGKIIDVLRKAIAKAVER